MESARRMSVRSAGLLSRRCVLGRAAGHRRSFMGSHSPMLAAAAPAKRKYPALLHVAEEVDEALATNKPVVALESTIYTHGAIGQDLGLEALVRAQGAVPAVIGVLHGRPTVGLTPEEVALMQHEGASKVSRRDLAAITLSGKHGGTTISGTMILARLAGIRVFGTGGLGGVHRGWQGHMDVSADLSELGRTRVAVVSSGCKGFLDIPATLEYLETHGVHVATFADGQDGPVDFPGFWARHSGVASPAVVRDEAAAAAIILAQEQLGIESGLLFANPIPAEAAIPREEMEAAIDQAVQDAAEQGFIGNRNTPFVLRRIRELTADRSIAANLALVQSNVSRAAKMAVELSALLEGSESSSVLYPARRESSSKSSSSSSSSSSSTDYTKTAATAIKEAHTDILVAGGVALDLSCDYVGLAGSKSVSPQLHTSNPASIRPSVGGVGHNVALAAHRVSPGSHVKLCSLIGDDLAGTTVLSAMEACGLDTTLVQRLPRESGARTAQYVAINDADKNLMVAMADMDIFAADHNISKDWAAVIAAAAPAPGWMVVDANWSAAGLRDWIRQARGPHSRTRVAFEPVSAAKSARLFAPGAEALEAAGVFDSDDGPLVDLATPNQHELAAMHAAAQEHGYFGAIDTDAGRRWFAVIDALRMPAGGARDRFDRLASRALTDTGVPIQALQLLPYIPTLVTKLGADGALLTKLLRADDPLLFDRAAERHILVRAPPSSSSSPDSVGGVYMRLFPPAETVADVVSVNGVGDTFLGALVAGLAQGGRVEQLINTAQQAAVYSLRSPEAVSPDLGRLATALSAAAAGAKSAR